MAAIKTVWTESDLNFLRKEYPRGKTADIASVLCKTVSAVKTRAATLNIRKDKEFFGIWNKANLSRLKEIYADMLNIDIAKEFGTTRDAIAAVAHKAGLKKSANFHREHMPKSAFQKGHVSANKGKKMSEFCTPAQIENIKKHWFPKGHLPHNTKKDFDIAERNCKGRIYLYIRTSLGKWEQLHRHVWEQAYGKIPKGTNIQFIDGNPLNCDIKNLYTIDRHKQMKKNSGTINLPDSMIATYLAGKNGSKDDYINHTELLELKRNQIKLNRKINEYGRKITHT